MRCEYCGRTNCDDGHGGCFACGAPVRYESESLAYANYVNFDATCSVSCYTPGPSRPLSRKRVIIG